MLEIVVAVLGLFCVALAVACYQLSLKLRQQSEMQKERDAMRDHAAIQCEDFSEEELQTAIELLTRLTSKVASTDPTLAHCGSRSHAKTSVGDES